MATLKVHLFLFFSCHILINCFCLKNLGIFSVSKISDFPNIQSRFNKRDFSMVVQKLPGIHLKKLFFTIKEKPPQL